jgi:hypothetical protein
MAPLPARPRRKVPTMWQVAEYWAGRDEFQFDLSEPQCFGCGVVSDWDEDFAGQTPAQRWTDASSWLERAHIVGRACYGLDGPQNTALLCRLCHRYQPDGNGADSIAWIQGGGIGWGERRIAAIRERDARRVPTVPALASGALVQDALF